MSFWIFSRSKKVETGMNVYVEFSKWIDKHLSEDLPDNMVAINFNLYEGSTYTYNVEIVGCGEFDENDSDWTCNEVFSTREDLFYITRTKAIAQWEQALSFITSIVEKYLREGKHADKLKQYSAVGIGFVDGDIDILYRSNKAFNTKDKEEPSLSGAGIYVPGE